MQSLMRCSVFKNLLLIKPGYDFSSSNIAYSSNIASSSTTVFVSHANNVESRNNDVKTVLATKNIDKGKSILGASPKLDKKTLKTLELRKAITKSLKKKKQHLYYYCGATRHT